MSNEHQCPKCGATLPADAPKGLCPRCLMAAALEPAPVVAVKPTIRIEAGTEEEVSERIDRYKILQKLGEGGCGVVYMAEQTEPVRRRVALKVIKLGMDTKQVIARFEAERQALALMDHPNIAKVLDAGTTETGRPYFVMELVKGIRITDYCDQNHLPTTDRLSLFTQVCQAIQHAHQKGIIHRDIKPSNILVTLHDGVPVPKVIDFGIAKATEQPLTEKTLFTAFGQFMGTPAYMSPEQAEMSGLDIDTRSDIYALGVLLYELLTGKTPFDAKELLQAGLDEMRRRIREEEPMRPSTRLSTMADADLTEVAQQRHSEPARLTRFIRGDLDWIVMKCLEKDRTRRYETANGLATDIRRHLDNEPVVARPPSAAYRLQKLVRRNKLAVAAVSAVAAALTIGLGLSTWLFLKERAVRQRAVAAENQAGKNAEQARKQERLASEQELLARRRFYAAQMNLANQAWEAGQLTRTMDLLETQQPQPGQTDLRNFEWFHLWGLCNERNRFTLLGHSGNVFAVAFSPDGNTLASGGEDGTIRVWDTTTGNEKATLKLDSSYPIINALVFTPDGKTLACGSWDRLIRLWDVSSGKLRATLAGHPGFVRCLAVSPDGKTLASGGEPGAVKLWDLATGKVMSELKAHQGPVTSIAFSSDSMTLATGSAWGEPEVGTALWNLSGKPHPIWKSAQYAERLAFSPDNQTLAVAKWEKILLLDASNGQVRSVLTGHLPPVNAVAFLPDGKTLVSCASDRTIRLWPWSEKHGSNTLSRTIGGHLSTVTCLAVAPDGALLASGASDGSVKIWSTAQRKSSLFTRFKFADQTGRWDALGSLLPSPRSNVVYVTTRNGTEVRDIATNRKQSLWPDAIGSAALSPDGRLLATGSQSSLVKLWDADTGRLLASVQAHTNRAPAPDLIGLAAIAFSADGRMLATANFEAEDTRVKLWDTEAALRPIRSLATPGIGVSALAFSPDGKRLAVGIRHTKLLLFDVSSGSLDGTIHTGGGAAEVAATAFSPDGKLLATCSYNATILWDVASRQPRLALRGHVGSVTAILFSPDGGTVATGGADFTVRLWDTVTGQERITFNADDEVNRVAFSRDGNTLFGASPDGTVRLWRQSATRVTEDADETDVALPVDQSSAWPLYHEAGVLRDQGKVAEADAKYHQALEAMKNAFGPEDRGVPVVLNTLANMIAVQGRLPEAERLHREAAQVARKLPPDKDHDEFLEWSLGDLGKVLMQQGKLDEAEDRYREALEMSRRFWTNNPFKTEVNIAGLVNILCLQGRYGDAEKLFTEVLTPDALKLPQSRGLLLVRSHFFGRRGLWNEAISDQTISLGRDMSNQQPWYELAPLLVASGDVAGYRRHCQMMLARFGATNDPAIARSTAKACLLLPVAEPALTTIASLTDTALTQPDDWREFVKGLAEYRQGHWSSAVDWMKKALAKPPLDRRDAQASMILAMAHHQLNQADEARAALASGVKLTNTKFPRLDSGDLGWNWHEILTAHILMREASALIKDNGSPGADASK